MIKPLPFRYLGQLDGGTAYEVAGQRVTLRLCDDGTWWGIGEYEYKRWQDARRVLDSSN